MEDIPNSEQIINAWLFHYVFHKAWKEFRTGHTVESLVDRDFVQSVLRKFTPDSPDDCLKFQLLVLICKLADGEDCRAVYRCNSNITALEDTILLLESLRESIPSDKLAELDAVIHETKEQAVYVCCREGHFHKAKEVFTRVWRKPTTEKAKTSKNAIAAVVKDENPEDELLVKSTYHCYLLDVVTFFSSILTNREKPFLVQASEAILENMTAKLSRPDDPHMNMNISGTLLNKITRKFKCGTLKAPKSIRSAVSRDALCVSTRAKKAGHLGRSSPAKGVLNRSNSRCSSESEDEDIETSAVSHAKTAGGKRTRNSLLMEERSNLNNNNNPDKCEDRQVASGGQRKDRAASEASVNSRSSGDECPQASPVKASSPAGIRNHRLKRNVQRENRHEPMKRAHVAAANQITESSEFESDGSGSEASEVIPKLRRKLDAMTSPVLRRSLAPSETLASSRLDTGPTTTTTTTTTTTGWCGPLPLRLPWCRAETEHLYKCVRKHGVGNWRAIRDAGGFGGRTNVNLKDRWRTMLKDDVLMRTLEQKFGACQRTRPQNKSPDVFPQ